MVWTKTFLVNNGTKDRVARGAKFGLDLKEAMELTQKRDKEVGKTEGHVLILFSRRRTECNSRDTEDGP